MARWTRRREPGRGRVLADDRGMSLIEILMAITIVGIAFASILTGLIAVTRHSDAHRKQAQAEAVLESAVERIRDPDTTHVQCAQVTTPSGSGYAAGYLTNARDVATPSGWVAADVIKITSIKYWSIDATGAFVFGPTCQDVDSDPTPTRVERLLHLQLITVEVKSPDGRATESVSVVKRCLLPECGEPGT